MKVGDIRMEMPTVDSELMLANRQKRRCEVVWIHPQWRFCVVEFTTELGWKFRETFYFADREPGKGPPLPEHIRREREASVPKSNRNPRLSSNKPKIGVFYLPIMR